MLEIHLLIFVEKIHEYGDVYSFVFKPEKPIAFIAGMYAHVRIPGGEEGQQTREFSIASAPSEEYVRFSVHVRKESPYKQRLAALAPGEKVEIFKIKGSFVLPEDASRDVVFIAGGIGITPIRSMFVELSKQGSSRTPFLIHVAEDGYLFEKELSEFSNEQKRIKRADVDNVLKEVLGKHHDAQYYVSGPPGFVGAIDKKLKELGIVEENVIHDEFFGYEGQDE